MVDFDEFLEGPLLTKDYVASLPSHIIKASLDSDYVKQLDQTQIIVGLIGFPFDKGALNFESRNGAETGPRSFREIIEIIKASTENGETGKNIAELKIVDFGDIST